MKEWMNGLLQARDSEWQEGWLLEEVSSCWFVEIMWDSIMKSLESEAKLELIQKKKKALLRSFQGVYHNSSSILGEMAWQQCVCWWVCESNTNV